MAIEHPSTAAYRSSVDTLTSCSPDSSRAIDDYDVLMSTSASVCVMPSATRRSTNCR